MRISTNQESIFLLSFTVVLSILIVKFSVM